MHPATGREVRVERQHEEFQVRALLQQFVVLPGIEEDHVTRFEIDGCPPECQLRSAPRDDVQLGFFVEVSGTTKRRMMAPDLSASFREHRKGLKERLHLVDKTRDGAARGQAGASLPLEALARAEIPRNEKFRTWVSSKRATSCASSFP